MRTMELVSLIFCYCFLLPSVLSAQQAVTVKGIVNCRGHRQPGTFVQLYDEDSVFDSDDLLGSVVADHRGVFCVKGSTEEFTVIEPYIFIEHNCGYEGLNEKKIFSKMIPHEYITEGAKGKHVYHMGDIELLTSDAPVQKYEKRVYVETNIDERIRQCIPVYMQYKTFYEKTVLGVKTEETILPTDEEPIDVEEPIIEPTEEETELVETTPGQTQVAHEPTEEERRLEEERLQLEEEQRKIIEIRRLQEEALRLEEIRRIEEEKLRIEEIRRKEEEEQRIELERREEERRLETERRAEEERKREEEAKLQEQRRKEQEEEHKRRMEEYHKREQERQEALKRREEEIKRREEEEKIRSSSVEKTEKKDPCVHYPVVTQTQTFSRDIQIRHEYVEDPCLRK